MLGRRIVTSNLKIAVASLILFYLLLLPHGVGELSPLPEEKAVPVEVSVVPAKKPLQSQFLPDKGATELPPIFKKISWCESKNMQFNPDGSVHRGVQNPQDVGRYQINEGYHLARSKALGIDIYTLQGNTDYTLILYKANGTRDWNWSKWCWDDQTVSTSTWERRFKENL